MKCGFIAKSRGIWPIGTLCEALGVSRSAFYAWCDRVPSERARTDAAILATMRTSFAISDQTYGVRRMLPEVRAAGHVCGRERVRRLMRTAALRARPRLRARPTSRHEGTPYQIAPNLLDRDFTATAPNQKWVADFTFVWTHEGWLYAAAVLDLYSRRIVGWAMQSTMTAQLVTDALLMAVWRRSPGSTLLHHSDQGTQYTSELFQRLLADHGITCSMSRSGNVWDNSVMESFFSTLKVERCYRRQYQTRRDAKADIFDYIERFYNPIRRHSALGNMSPSSFEQESAVA